MEQAIATVGIWVAVAAVAHKDTLAAIVVAYFAMLATTVVWGA